MLRLKKCDQTEKSLLKLKQKKNPNKEKENIMNYQEFKDTVIKRLEDHYGVDANVKVIPVSKNNGYKYDGIQISFPKKQSKVIPVIQMENLYERYNNGEITMSECEGAVVKMREKWECDEIYQEFAENCMTWDDIKDKVYPILLGTDANEELLVHLVHKDYLDLSIAYIIRNSFCRCACSSIKITPVLMQMYGIDHEQLHQQAMENLEKDGYKFMDMEYTMMGLVMQAGGLECDEEYPPVTKLDKGRYYILTNPSGLYGAAGILNTKLLREILGDTDCYILPSSVHETIFCPADPVIDQKELDRKVAQVNRDVLNIEDVLTDHSYYYDCSTQEIRIRK